MRFFAILSLIVGCAWPLTADDASLTYSVEVELAQVVVRVAGADGRPVQGLHKDDFLLTEDGVRLEVEFLDEAGNGSAPVPAAPPQSSAARSVGNAVSLNSILIIFDTCNSGQFGIEKHKRYVKEFLENFQASNTIFCILLIKAGGDYEMVQNFTSAKSDLIAQIESIQGGAAGIEDRKFKAANIADSSRMEHCLSTSGYSRTECAQEALRDVAFKANGFASEEQTRSSNSIRSLREIFSMAEHVPGQKSIILVSEGFDPAGAFYYNYGADVIEHFIVNYGLPTGMRSVLSESNAEANRSISKIQQIQDLVRSANTARMSVYWINPEYGKKVEDISSELSNMSSFTTKLVNAPDSDLAMRGVSDDTGGAALSSTDMSEFYRRISTTITNYYLISYKPHRSMNDGRYHKVEVRTRNSEYKVSYANGFKDFETRDRIADQLAAAHDFPDLTSSFPLLSEIHYFRNADGRYHVMIYGAAKYSDLSPVSSGNISQDDVHLSLIVRNANGKIVLNAHPILQIRLPDDRYAEYSRAGKFLDHVESMNLDSGAYEISLAAMDVAKWKTASVSTTLRLPSSNDPCLSVSPPMLASSVTSTDAASDQPSAAEGGAIRYKGKMLTFSIDRIFSQTGSLNGFYQIYNVHTQTPAATSVYVSFKLFRDHDQFINQTPEQEISSFIDPLQKLISNFFSVPYKNLSPGEYQLEINVHDAGGCKATSRVSFHIQDDSQN